MTVDADQAECSIEIVASLTDTVGSIPDLPSSAPCGLTVLVPEESVGGTDTHSILEILPAFADGLLVAVSSIPGSSNRALAGKGEDIVFLAIGTFFDLGAGKAVPTGSNWALTSLGITLEDSS